METISTSLITSPGANQQVDILETGREHSRCLLSSTCSQSLSECALAGARECERDPAGADFTQAPPAAAACTNLTLTEPAWHSSG